MIALESVKDKIIFNEKQIQEAVRALADRINRDYAGEELLLVGILRGAFVFLSDLSRTIRIPHVIDFMAVSSYGSGASTSGLVRIESDLRENVAGRHVLIVEDVVDTGLTFAQLKQTLEARQPKSVKICALLDKPANRQNDLAPDYWGLRAPDTFLVGYGLDFLGYLRTVPYIFSINESARRQLVDAGELEES